MKTIILLSYVICLSTLLVGQTEETIPSDYGNAITIGKTGVLGVETSTTFAADLSDGSTGLETKAGIEAIFDLFPRADRGIMPENMDSPFVRIELKNAAFTWWNTYQTAGSNYEQDDFNTWTAQPLVLSFDSLTTDVVWNEYYLRVAGTKPSMRIDSASLGSIFDEVMDAVKDRWYVTRMTALYYIERYNTLHLPVLQHLIPRDLINIDLQSDLSGQLGIGATFENWHIDLLAGSFYNGVENNSNQWSFKMDASVTLITGFTLSMEALAAINRNLTGNENPVAFGVSAEYLVPLSEKVFIKPFTGFDGNIATPRLSSFEWEAGGGVFLYLRGADKKVSYRDIDRDEVIPAGFSIAMNIDYGYRSNIILSYFDNAGEDSTIKNFGGFAQIEAADIFAAAEDYPYIAATVQVECLIGGVFLPYIREQFGPEFVDISGTLKKTGYSRYTSAAGLYITPIKYFSVDLMYERTDRVSVDEVVIDPGTISLQLTISM